MNKTILVLVGIACAVISAAGCTALPQKETVIKKIQQFNPNIKELPPDLDNEETLIGHFASPNPALTIGGLSGHDLYLFPDKTYFYIEWADIAPAHITDKGIWVYKDGLLTLQSDNFFQKKYQPREKNYTPMLFPYKGKDWLFIMGLEWHFLYYKEKAAEGDGGEIQLLVCTLGKSETITNGSKTKLFTKYWRSGYSELDELLKSNNKTIELNPKDTIAWYIKGETLHYLRRDKESIEAFDEAIKLTPGLSDAWYYRACIYSDHQNDKQNALSNLAQAISLDVELKEKARKDGYFKELWEDEEFKKITFIPGYELREAALKAIAKNRFDEARELSNKALKANPSFEDELCNVWWNKGWECERTNRLEEAVICYDNASECASKAGFHLFDKAKILDKLGRYDVAIEVYDKIIELEPNHKDIWYAWRNKASDLSKLGRYEEAFKVYDKYLELAPNPDRSWAWCNKGNMLSRLGKYDEAVKAYDKATEIDPKHASCCNKGDMLSKLGKYDEAIKEYDKSIEIDSKHPCRGWYGRACVYSLTKNKKETLDSLAKAANICKKRKEQAKTDEAFKWLWDDEEFKKITKDE